MPDPVKNLFAPVIRGRLIYNKVFRDQIDELERMHKMTYAQIEDAQFEKLKETLTHAYEHTPYYRKLFDELNFNVYKFDDLKEFERIPAITRAEIISRTEELQADDIADYYSAATGGSTGEPMRINLDRDSIYKERAFIYTFWKEYGYDYTSSKLASFRGTDFEGKSFKSNPLYHEMQFNPTNIKSGTIGDYVKKCNSFEPDFIQGYPSAVYNFCRYMNEAGLTLKKRIKCVFFISENVYEYQRKFIEETLGCRSAAFYGHTERAVFAEESGAGYRFHDFYGYWEINPRGNIICTGFINRRTPLIRYELDDFAEKTGDRYRITGHRDGVLYGLHGEVISVAGHKNGILFGHAGGNGSTAALEFDEEFLKYSAGLQIVQNETGKITVKAVAVKQGGNAAVLEALRDKIRCLLGESFDVTVESCSEFILSERGKFRFLVQNIDKS